MSITTKRSVKIHIMNGSCEEEWVLVLQAGPNEEVPNGKKISRRGDCLGRRFQEQENEFSSLPYESC